MSKTRTSLRRSLWSLKPTLVAALGGLSSLVVHAGSCNVTTPGASACAIPADVVSVQVVATGGGGGGAGNAQNGKAGGAAGVVTATLSGVGGTTLSLFVGGGGSGSLYGGSGGGSSNVNAGTPAQIIAGGGGGAGAYGVGGNGNGGAGGNGNGGAGGAGGGGGVGGSGPGAPGHSGNGGAGGLGFNGSSIGSGSGVGGESYCSSGAGGGGFGGGAGGGCFNGGGGGGGSTGGALSLASNGGAVGGLPGGSGSIVITWADPSVPPLTGQPSFPGIGTQPAALDLNAGQGPTLNACLLSALRSLLGSDAVYVGESSNGVVKYLQGGRTIAFYVLQVNTQSKLGATIITSASNVLTLGTTCASFTVAPALSDMSDFGAWLNTIGLQANINAQGVITLTVGGTTYVFRPDYQVTAGPAGAPSLTLGSDGLYRFADGAGNVQILRPVFADMSALINQLPLALGRVGTTVIQTDGTALFTTNAGQQYVLTPDLTLTAAPTADAALLWWQDAPNHYFIRSSLVTMAQGFTVVAR